MGKVLFVACTNVGQTMIDAMMASPKIRTQIVGIVNLNAKQALGKANYRTYLDTAQKYGIPLHFCEDVNDPETCDWIAEKEPDIVLQTGWSQKFGSRLLNIPKYGCIGEHPAPLPRGRGAACINWAILTGEREWGDTFFHMVDQYDAGAVYAQELFRIEAYDDVKTVYDKVAQTSRRIILEHIDDWTEGRFSSIALDESKATYYKKRRPSDGVFTFQMPQRQLHDFIRAQTEPYPGAFFMLGEEKITVLASRLTGLTSSQAPGSVLGTTDNGGIHVVCGDGGVLELLRYRTEDGAYVWFGEDPRFTATGLCLNG